MTSTTQHVPGLPREIKTERTTVEMPGVERIDAVYLSKAFVGHIAWMRREASDDHGTFDQQGWVPLNQGKLTSFGLRLKRDAIKLLPDVAVFLETYDGSDPVR